MHAILLFSAVLHLAAIGLVAAFALRAWLDSRRHAALAQKDPTVPETVGAAGGLGVLVLVLATLLVWMGTSFGHALATGLVAGLITALSLLLALGALPHAAKGPNSAPSYAARVTVAALIGVLILTELIAFSFLVTAAGGLARYA